MKITIDQQEIEEAIATFIGTQGINTAGKVIKVTMIAGRAPNGPSAAIEITNAPVGEAKVVGIDPAKPGADETVVVEKTPDESISKGAQDPELVAKEQEALEAGEPEVETTPADNATADKDAGAAEPKDEENLFGN